MSIARYETVAQLRWPVHCELWDSNTPPSGVDFLPRGFSVVSSPDVSGCHSETSGGICAPFLSDISIIIESQKCGPDL